MFYVKPLVRYYYYFYMSDHMNAVYNVMCIVAKYVPLTVGQIVVPIYCHKSVKGLTRYFNLKTKSLGKRGLNDVTDVMIIMHLILNLVVLAVVAIRMPLLRLRDYHTDNHIGVGGAVPPG